MKSLQQIYDKLDLVQSDVLGSCGGQCDTNASIAKTGQTEALWQGDDGHLEKGVAWPDPRLTENGDGTFTDNLTGLVWTAYNLCYKDITWKEAVDLANNLADGECNLTDGSVAGDWRLPNVREFESLVDYGKSAPALPLPRPWSLWYGGYHWTSTTVKRNIEYSWVMDIYDGQLRWNKKVQDCFDPEYPGSGCYGIIGFWAVRDPN